MLTSERREKKKQGKIRNSEYYGMEPVFDTLYAESRNGKTFNHLMEIIESEENIKLAYRTIKRNHGSKTPGVDKKTIRNLAKLSEDEYVRLVKKKFSNYHPRPVRREEIPKDNGKMRPLSIYCYEDKLVQEALRRILEAVFEPIFYDEMMGFRPNRGCHKAIRKLNLMLERKPTSYVLDADIKGFFQHLDHEWIIRFIGSRIKDPNIIRLVRRMLKAGIMNNYEFEETEEGSGQGSVCSPVISCIYMHYVLVWWFKEVITPKLKGYAGLVVYADDCAPRRRELVA